MKLSARNQLSGTVKSVKLGNVMAEVVVEVAGSEIVSAITRASAESLNLKSGVPVTVIIKATEVMLAAD
jgi:molybdopterin-binding protein